MKKYILILIMAATTLLPAVTSAQITCQQVRPESCNPGNDGAASVTMPSAMYSY